ncbi:MAG: alpha/beta hydrolase [Cyclobacteriaceae bacterium]|nr:alpha/beta hydrolase [Cyclobacteriaceae bacterium]
MQAQPVPLDTTYTVASTFKKLVKTYPGIKPVKAQSYADVTEQYDVVYKAIPHTAYGTRNLLVDVFVPKESSKEKPAVILVHGGGWRSGNKSLNTPMAQALAHLGFVVFSVEYRLSLEAKYPAALHDLKACVRWVRHSAKEYGVDENKIAIAGSSAGGQMASLLGVTNGRSELEDQHTDKIPGTVQAVIDMDGLLDFTDAENLALPRTENSADVFWLEGFYEQNKEKWQQASALTWVSKQSPPFLFINSSQTRFHAGHAQMVKQLNKFGIYNHTVKWNDAPHSFWLFHPWFDPTVNAIEEFLKHVFNR